MTAMAFHKKYTVLPCVQLRIKALKTLKWYLSRKSMSGINSFKETYCSDIGLKVNPPSK